MISNYHPEIIRNLNFGFYSDLFFEIFGDGEFFPSSNMMNWIAQQICGHIPLTDDICASIMFLFAGYSKDNFNITRIPIYISHTPAGTSSKNILHFGQQVNSDKFRMFDYGIVGLILNIFQF